MMERVFDNSDYVVRVVDLPVHIHGIIDFDEDGRANIYINKADPPEVQKSALNHEFKHMILNHFYSDRPVEELEAEADAFTLNLYEERVTEI